MLYGGGTVNGFSTADGIYFSFVTLATLGYGDFVPKTEVARGLVILEAIAGQLYLAVMVARLVSLYVSGAARKRNQSP
jgi:voltage-gated potassium channel Kch